MTDPKDEKPLPPSAARRAGRGVIAARITPEMALQFSMDAFDNAQRLLAAADDLYSKGHYGSACSLAISAREELGKFCAALFYCTGQIDAKRFADLVHGHSSKQTLGAMLALCIHMFKGQFGALTSIAAAKVSSIAELYDLAAKQLQPALDSMPPLDEDALANLQERLLRTGEGDDDARRTAGLYVDLVEQGGALEVRTPTTITADQTREDMDSTRSYVNFISGIVDGMQVADGGAGLTAGDVVEHLKGLAAKYPLRGASSAGPDHDG